MTAASDFIAALKPASWRGVPFGVTESRKTFGRRVAVHEYPFRDVQWVEDLGRKGRSIGLSGFLVNSLKYGGGSVLDQQQAMIAAIETAGPGKLVHPTLGELTVSCLSGSINEAMDAAGVFTVDFEFLEAGQKVFPTTTTSTGDQVASAAVAANAAAASDLSAAATPLLAQGATIAQTALGVSTAWASQVQTLGGDATSLLSLASPLPGEFGRFFNGRNLGVTGLLASVLPVGTDVSDLVGLAADARQAIAAAASAVISAAGALGLGASSSSPAQLAAAGQALAAQLLGACADPADAVRLLSAMASYAPAGPGPLTPIGAALGDVFRRAAVTALAQAASAYQPWSYTDANAVRLAVTGLLDNEIEIAGDEGEDASFNALRALRVAVVQDLTARGASLSPIVGFSFGQALPSLVLAQRLYRDPSRADQLVTEANPVHPLFMPTVFQALAA